ncbi:hypothetical protein DVA67_001620 [Solirubrobacter sp. CPCC 204708]|uniref:Uncharacterized protein n=1 Tax=Solirubrobacter deserti TaxID=2282478 RepID=A0ABT4RDP8_9ACTN|nr:hypothetical protein [Solirubrobacter deserti]MBE2314656.1 hypothetical protein [Solirubrobacter deserti]MDA0136664.1 hypothetical protein [Solirubrobacter deserti]
MRAIVAALVAFLAAAAPALAHDSLAPAGADHNWLPDEEWVHRHWVPFDERALESALRLRPGQLEAYLYNDHHTVAALARARGMELDPLVARLAPSSPLLRERTVRVLTQGHLAQHLFFHVFHGLDLHPHAEDVFGMPADAYRALREEGASYAEIAREGDVPVARLRAHARKMLAADRRDGVARGEAVAASSARVQARALRRLDCWLTRPAPALDPGNPYGKNRFLHGSHAAGWPGTAAERRADDRRVERFRRGLMRACWPHPKAWKE